MKNSTLLVKFSRNLVAIIVLFSFNTVFSQTNDGEENTINKTNISRAIGDFDDDGVPDASDQDNDNDGIIDSYECSVYIQFDSPSLLTATDLNDLQIGEKVVYANALLFQNQFYDIILTLTGISGSVTVDVNTELEAIGFNPNVDEYVTYSFDLVESGSATIGNPTGTPVSLNNIIIGLQDLDHGSGQDYTEVFGFNTTTVTSSINGYLDTSTNLEAGGFINAAAPANFSLYRLNPAIAGSASDWIDEPNDSSPFTPEFTVFMEFDVFSHVDLILGVTGTETSAGLRHTHFIAESNCDDDNDNLVNKLDIDADNDGIPDNVEAQPTNLYILPSVSVDPITGIPTVYGSGLIPEDTDNDNTPDFTDFDSDNDGTPDIQENGMADSITTFTDADEDGLDNLFETNGILDIVRDVNEDIEDPTDLTILPDTDGDLVLGGDLDYRDAIDIFIESASIDFDGIDDYVEANPSVINDQNEFTISFWIKPESFPTGDVNDTRFVLGQKDRFEIEIGNDEDGEPKIWSRYYYGSGSSSRIGTTISTDEWMHYTVTFNFANELIQVYNNGVPIAPFDAPNTPLSNDNPLRMGSKEDVQPAINSNYMGWLDEVRIFYGSLTSDQVQQMVYQEIKQNGTYVQGTLIEKDIIDFTNDSKVLWTDLASYYPMTNILNSKLIDQSSYKIDAVLNNIQSALPQTAPIPYETENNGDWTDENTWLYGDVWDIEDVQNNKDWIIVKLNDNVTTTHSHVTLGMFMGSKRTLTVKNDNLITNNWYLQLDGTIDLENDSQLIQGMNSDLVTSDEGKILRRQEGNSNFYWYNYWSSPVGSISTTLLSDNNSPSNNENNSPFNLEMLKDNNGDDIVFTSAFDEEGMVSDRWLFSYLNGLTFWDWITLTPTSDIAPGVGYTQKGTGIDSNPDPLITEQQYTFVGKPNNGTILIQADDVDNDGDNESEQDETLTTSFVGNPYPSALDARQFIEDNEGVIGGALYVWEQWSGIGHILEEYQGGYGTISNFATERAYQWNDPNPDPDESPFARKPTFYIPVAQGFFVEVVNDGDNAVLSIEDDIEFNNGQRIFIKESDADGVNPNNGSVFFRDGNPDTNDSSQNIGMMRLELKVSNGNSRSFVLAFSDVTTDGYDYGFDARTIDPQEDDLNSFLGNDKMLIQSFSPITDDKVIDLVLNSSGIYNYTIEMVEILDIPEEQTIYLLDNLTGTYFDLRSGAYDFSSDLAGEDSGRFDIVFQDETLSTEDELFNDVLIFVNNADKRLYVKGLTEPIENLVVTNLLGQTLITLNNVDNNSLENGIYLGELSSGLYMVNLTSQNNLHVSKKIILN